MTEILLWFLKYIKVGVLSIILLFVIEFILRAIIVKIYDYNLKKYHKELENCEKKQIDSLTVEGQAIGSSNNYSNSPKVTGRTVMLGHFYFWPLPLVEFNLDTGRGRHSWFLKQPWHPDDYFGRAQRRFFRWYAEYRSCNRVIFQAGRQMFPQDEYECSLEPVYWGILNRFSVLKDGTTVFETTYLRYSHRIWLLFLYIFTGDWYHNEEEDDFFLYLHEGWTPESNKSCIECWDPIEKYLSKALEIPFDAAKKVTTTISHGN